MAHSIQLAERSLGKTPASATIVSLCLALLSIASAAIFIKFSEQEISPYATAFNRFWITTVILGLWSSFKAVRRQQESRETLQSSPYTAAIIGQLFLVGLFLAADLMLWAWSLTQTSVANATLLANLTPVFSCLGGWLFCRRRFDQQFLCGMVIAIAAIFAIGFNDCQIASGKFIGDIAALIAAVSFSVYLSVLERLQSQLGATRILLWSSAIASLVSLPIVLIDGGQLFPTSWQGWLTVISLAGVCQILGQAMLVHSLDRLSSEFVALFLLLEPILAGVGAWALFSEQLGLLNLVAFAIALVGVYLSLSSPSALRNEAIQPSFATLQLETDPKNREQEVVQALLNSCVAKKEISIMPEKVLAGVKRR